MSRTFAIKLYAILYSNLFILLWGFSTIFYRHPLTKVFYLFVTILIVLGGFVLKKIILDFTVELRKQILSILVFIALLYGILSTFGLFELFSEKREGYILIAISNIACIFSIVIQVYALNLNLNIKSSDILARIYKTVRDNFCFILLLLVIIALSFDSCQSQIKWDGMIYFNQAMNADMYSLSSLGIVGHLTHGYALIVSITRLLLLNSGMTMLAVNICLLIYSSICFYRLIVEVFSDIRRTVATLLTSVYAFSPFLMGMVNYYSPDYMFTCLLIPIVYYALRKKWGIFSFISFFFVFTKEPAIVAFFGICVGILIIDYIENKNVKMILLSAKYYYMLSVGLLWGLMYMFLGAWVASNSDENAFEPSLQYIIDKLKVMYVLNNNWIFVLLTIIGLFIARKSIRKFLIPVIVGTVFFTGISVAFVTMNHPRYAAISTPALILCAIICWGDYLIRHKKLIILIISSTFLSLVMLISCFITIDPISRRVFNSVNIGKTSMITSGNEKVGDNIVYNKQALWLEKVVNEAIEYGLDNDATIIFPGNEGSFYSYDGMVEVSITDEMGFDFSEEFWDVKNKRRNGVLISRKQMEELKIYRIESIDSLRNGKYCYVQQPTDDSCLYEEIKDSASEIEEQSISYRGWVVKAVLFEVNK